VRDWAAFFSPSGTVNVERTGVPVEIFPPRSASVSVNGAGLGEMNMTIFAFPTESTVPLDDETARDDRAYPALGWLFTFRELPADELELERFDVCVPLPLGNATFGIGLDKRRPRWFSTNSTGTYFAQSGGFRYRVHFDHDDSRVWRLSAKAIGTPAPWCSYVTVELRTDGERWPWRTMWIESAGAALDFPVLIADIQLDQRD
jgi:hypothetical protein